MTPPHDRYRRYLETLTPETLKAISDYVTEDVRFKDPFNDVRGVDFFCGSCAHKTSGSAA